MIPLEFKTLKREDIHDIWSIDRSERIEKMYRFEQGELILVDKLINVTGWPQDEIESDTSSLLECFDHGGFFLGVYDNSDLVGICVLESRFIGSSGDQLQLKFLHVSQKYRGKGLGRRLFMMAAERAKSQGAQKLYISATPSENTIHFYQSLGCRLTTEIDSTLFTLEPEDIHLECELD